MSTRQLLGGATNGPSGKDCEHGRHVDASPFNDRFTCDCADTKYTGANCESSDRDADTTIEATLGVAVGLAVLGAIGALVQHVKRRIALY